MKFLIFTILILLSLNPTDKYPTKHGRPTPKGVGMYVEDNEEQFIQEYQEYIKDTLWLEVWIIAEDLTDYVGHDSLELGAYWNGEIYIDMDTNFVAYELKSLSKFKRAMIGPSDRFVKGTVFHELTHHYMNQIGKEMEFYDSVNINRAYQDGFWIIRNPRLFGAMFIEEGICEYMVTKMGENIPHKRFPAPKNVSELTNPVNKYKFIYKYSSEYVREFLDTTGFKQGVKMLMSHEPPSHNEILNPELFFNRLDYGQN